MAETLGAELAGLTKPKLLEWASEHRVEIPEAIKDKPTILDVILDSAAAQTENYRRETHAAIASQCLRRGLTNELDDVRVADSIVAKYGAPVDEMDAPTLIVLNRELDMLFVAILQGLKRKPGSRPRPAGLRL